VATAFGAAILSAVCYGLATALQARGVRSGGTAPSTDAELTLQVLSRWPFVVGILLDVAGFGAQLLALRGLPVFVVQAAQAGNLAVTALAAVPLLGLRLPASRWIAVLAVCAGLALLGASSGAEGTVSATSTDRLILLVAAVVLAVAGIAAARLRSRAGPIALGLVAGLGFGVTALAVRSLPSLAIGQLVRDPATYAAAVSGPSSFLCFAAGLQRGAVTAVSALVIMGETILPAIVGVVFWDDRTRPGWAVPAVAGFALAVAGALALARYADPEAV
jgi:drug/metabolite transporter (DMT)-like permease